MTAIHKVVAPSGWTLMPYLISSGPASVHAASTATNSIPTNNQDL